MKLLVLLDSVYSENGATNRICRAVCEELARTNDVTVLENARPDAPLPAHAKARYARFCCGDERRLYTLVNGWRTQKRSRAAMALRLLGHPRAAWAGVCALVFHHSVAEGAFRRRAERLCRQEPFDLAVSMSVPHYTAFALARARCGCKKAAYLLEPYATNALVHDRGAMRREAAMYAAMDCVCVTPLMLAENRTNALAPYLARTKAFAFPNFRPLAPQPAADAVAFDRTHYTELLFAGMLYPAIRSPQFVLELMEMLPQNFRLTFLGGGADGFAYGYFEDWQKRLGPRLRLHGAVSPDAAMQALLDADILVSIGNAVANQLPSKLLDYISSGKPVLNTTKVPECPSLALFRAYPLVCSLAETAHPDADACRRAEAFCRENAGKQVPFAQLEKLYREYTLQDVCARLNDAFAAALEERP